MYKFTNHTKIENFENGARISDGFLGLRLKCAKSLQDARHDDVKTPSALFNRLGLNTSEIREAEAALLEAGLIQTTTVAPMLDASYLAQRLKAFYVRKSQEVWKQNPALKILNSEAANNMLAKGFLIETYHHVKGAKWTSVPVLGHSLTREQRELFEKFYIGERNHFGIFEKALTLLDLDCRKIKSSIPNTETELLERNFHSLASACPLEFATALIAPEVDGLSHYQGSKSEILDKMVAHHGIPEGCAKAFRIHGDDHESEDHDSLPLQLISSYGQIPVEKACRLFDVLNHTIHAYDVMFRGIYQTYSNSFSLRQGRYAEWL